MQLSLVAGVVTNGKAEFELSYPINLEPLIVNSKISNGQLRTAAGAVPYAQGPGPDRGGINWNGICYRAMGTKLVRLDADRVTVLAEIGGSGSASFDYSFDRLLIRSDDKLFYWNGTAVQQVSDPDLGSCLDMLFVDGYTMSTDGRFVVVTELNDPFQVKPLKYGSAEADPDGITGLLRIPGSVDIHVLGRHTIQVIQNIGGSGFPFAVVRGATIPFGCVSATAKCPFGPTFAFAGSSRDQALGVFLAGQGTASRISTRAVEDALAAEPNPSGIVLERRSGRDESRLYVHLSKETWVFLGKATEAAGEAIWYRCRSGARQPYRLRHAVDIGDRVIVGDVNSSALGLLTAERASHFGDPVQWQFDIGLLYNAAKGAIVDTVELVGMTGRADDDQAMVFMSSTRDGQTFSPERAVSMGRRGERTKRVQWRPHFRMRNFMGFRFRGFGDAAGGFAACEVGARPLRV